MLFSQKYACYESRGVLRGVHSARLVFTYSGDGASDGTYKVGVGHSGGTYYLTRSSDNMGVSAKQDLVAAINAQVASSVHVMSPVASFLERALMQSVQTIVNTQQQLIAAQMMQMSAQQAAFSGASPAAGPYPPWTHGGPGARAVLPPQAPHIQKSMGPAFVASTMPTQSPINHDSNPSWFTSALTPMLAGIAAAPDADALLRAIDV